MCSVNACRWEEESAVIALVKVLASHSVRFTEFLVEEMKSTEDLRQLILSYFPGVDLPNALTDGTIR